MDRYLNTTIKEIITKFPKVGTILDEHGIGCAPCNVGSCLLKDIVEIHNLSEKDERELLLRIAKVIYPGKETALPKIERKKKPVSGEIRYSPPIKRLVDEHTLIKRLVSLIPRLIENLDVGSEEGKQIVLKCVDFIRNYADRYHHAKEEEILFKYFDEGLDMLKAMHQDHESARGHVKAVLEALDRRDEAGIRGHLNAYKELLAEHIKKEDEILYPWMDRNLSTTQIGELFSDFNRVGEEFEGISERYEGCIDELERLGG